MKKENQARANRSAETVKKQTQIVPASAGSAPMPTRQGGNPPSVRSQIFDLLSIMEDEINDARAVLRLTANEAQHWLAATGCPENAAVACGLGNLASSAGESLNKTFSALWDECRKLPR